MIRFEEPVFRFDKTGVEPRQAIQAALDRFHNNRTKAAQAIGISVRTLIRKLSQHNVPGVVLFRPKSDP